MRGSFTDKLIVFVLCAMQSLLLPDNMSVGLHVAWVLAVLTILLYTELWPSAVRVYPAALAAVIAAYFVPEISLAFPIVVYGLAYAPLMKNKGLDIAVRIILIVIMAAGTVYLRNDIMATVMTCVISAVSVYLAFKTVTADRNERLLRSKYDDARQDSYNARRLGEEIIKNADNEVYTARLKERNRIAREIHDNVGHMITRVIVQMQAIKIINKDEKVASQLDSVSDTLDLAMTGIRKSVHELHDDSIDVSIAIGDIIKTLPSSIEAEVVTSIDSPADNDTKNTILGIIKEAVTNISKYSKGDKARIEVIENNTFWRIRVWDNGVNPDSEYILNSNYMSSEGIGLKNIASRANALGGRASVRSGSDGFEVIATLPKKGDNK